ncbi:MAG: hypothetical protein ACRC34_02940, partial [Cetobacterium sp.]
NRLSVDSVVDLKMDMNREFIYSTHYGVLKRNKTNLDLIETEKMKRLEKFNNSILISKTSILNNNIENNSSGIRKISYQNFDKSIILENNFAWNIPRKMMIGDNNKISNSRGEMWNIDINLEFIDVKKNLEEQEILYDGKIYLYSENKLKLNTNLDNIQYLDNIDILRVVDAEKIGLIFKDSKWTFKNNSNKITIDGVNLEDTFVSGKLNFDFISGIGSSEEMYSNKYIWNIKNRKLLKKLDYEIEDIFKMNKEIYFKYNSEWFNQIGERKNRITVKIDDKWNWIFDIQNQKVIFKNNLKDKIVREIGFNQFKDDSIINLKADQNKTYLSTKSGVLVYNQKLNILKDYYEKLKSIPKNQLEVPNEIKNHKYIDYYEKFGIYHLIKTEKIELVNKKRK